MQVKSGFSFNTDGLGVGDDCDAIRCSLGIPATCGGVLDDELSDVALASIVRFHVLRAMLYSADVSLSCFAAGIIGAARQLYGKYYWGGLRYFAYNARYHSWPSAVVKFAGWHLHSMFRPTGRDSTGWSQATNDVYICVNNCVEMSLASTVSDDAHISRQQMMLLYDQGVLIKPTPKAWRRMCEVLNVFVGNQFRIDGTEDIGCRLSFKFANGNHGTKPWAPARTVALLQYACDIAPRAAVHAITGTSAVRDCIRKEYYRFASERRRYAMWVCGNSADAELQVQCFDLLVANLFDRVPVIKKQFDESDWLSSYYRRAFLYAPIESAGEGTEDVMFTVPKSGGHVESMRIPPWADFTQLQCPTITPTPIGSFDVF